MYFFNDLRSDILSDLIGDLFDFLSANFNFDWYFFYHFNGSNLFDYISLHSLLSDWHINGYLLVVSQMD